MVAAILSATFFWQFARINILTIISGSEPLALNHVTQIGSLFELMDKIQAEFGVRIDC
jgi:hypothetical protein